MSRLLISLVAAIATAWFVAPAFAKDVFVRGYVRKDGTYVRPHIRSSPNNIVSDNYGPSKTDDQLMNPRSRDYDGDGTPNYLDADDDNDGLHDDGDGNQYGGGRLSAPDVVSPAPVMTATRIVLNLGIDYAGGDYAQARPTSLQACHDYCFADSQCVGFSYVESKDWCWLKSDLGAPLARQGIVSGAKQ